MTTSRHYTLITPRADRTGPTNLAVDIGQAASASGWQARLLYLSGAPTRDDLAVFAEARRFRLSDVWRLQGVVHTHGLRPDLVGWLFTWSQRCTVLTTLHGHFPGHLRFDYAPWKVRLAWGLWSAALSRFSHRVCISRTMLRHYRRTLPKMAFDLAYNFRASRPSGVGQTYPDIESWIQTQRAERRVVLVYIGSLTPRKNVRKLVDAVLGSPGLAMVMCGRGDEREPIATELQSRDPDRRVLLAGHLNDAECIVAKSDALVLASYAEGLPLVVIEAASIGVPCLMSNIAVHRELAALGLGLTFDHRGFSDFARRATLIAQSRSPENDLLRVTAWQGRFSSQQGFSQYEQMLAHPE